MSEEAEYFCKDFDWEELRDEIESNVSYRHHILPFDLSISPSSSSSTLSSPLDCSNAWKNFHQRHSSGRFFKERRYLLKEFPELRSCPEFSTVLEVGCGNGSSVLPILRGNPNIIVYASDCSREILERAKEMIHTADGIINKQRFHPFLCDFYVNQLPNWLLCNSCRKMSTTNGHMSISGTSFVKEKHYDESSSLHDDQCCLRGVDFVTLIFTLSAVPFRIMPSVLRECFCVMKSGGFLFFRDYGVYDMTMVRFQQKQRVGFREYMRSDGTLSCFFSLESVRDLFLEAGFIEVELDYCCIKSVNRRNGKTMGRVWVHGKFQKPNKRLV